MKKKTTAKSMQTISKNKPSSDIEVRKIRREHCATAEGFVVVIDVIRAFTTTAFAFAAGAEKIILVGTVEEAFRLHALHPEYLLMGETDANRVPGFHFENSPAEIEKQNLKGKTLIQRTSSGTQGVVQCVSASQIYVSSFVVAQATLKKIQEIRPKLVTFVITGFVHGGFEDFALADYLEACLNQTQVDPHPYLQRVLSSPSGKKMINPPATHAFWRDDLKAVMEIDRFPFAMHVVKESGLNVLYKSPL